MNIAFFSCIYFELTSIKQTTLNKWGSKWLVHVFFAVLFIYISTCLYLYLHLFTFLHSLGSFSHLSINKRLESLHATFISAR